MTPELQKTKPSFQITDVSGWWKDDAADAAIAGQLFQHWSECRKTAGYDTNDDNWETNLIEFCRQNQTAGLRPRTYVAKDAKQVLLGSIHCQIWAGPLPWVVQPDIFRLGTVWGLRVESSIDPALAEKIRRELLLAALQHLRSVQCSKVVTLASTNIERNELVNAKVGFQSANMMTLGLGEMESVSLELTPRMEKPYECGSVDGAFDRDVCQNWSRMWNDVGIPTKALLPNMEGITLSFLKDARERLHYQTFLARDKDRTIGSVSCQIWEGPMPISKQFQLGTIWAVYVDPAYRRQGAATELMKQALQHLKNIGCDAAILIAASEGGQRLYENLGFQPNDALVCDLSAFNDSGAVEVACETIDRGEEKKDDEATDVVPENEKRETSNARIIPKTEAMKKDLRSALKGLLKDMSHHQINALTTATTQQIYAVYGDNERLHDIAAAVKEVQQRYEAYIDPNENWFTQNVTKFGRGFNMKRLHEDPAGLASKFDRLATHYDHWTVGNQSKVEAFIVRCARNNKLPLENESTRVLDVACGIGLQGQVLRLCDFPGELVGTDISQGMVHRVMERGCYNHAYVANANDSLVDDLEHKKKNHYDIVICTGAMELLDQGAVLSDIAQMTKPKGEIWVSFQYDAAENPTEHQNVQGISQDKATDLLTQAGFSDILSVEVCPDAFYTPSPKQDGSLLPVPYLFIVARKGLQ